MHFHLNAKFSGAEADRHRIPAYEGATSLEGVSRSLVMISSFISTGEVRRRAPFSQGVKVFLEPLRSGSLEAIYTFFIENPEMTALGLGVAANFLSDGIKTVIGRAIGNDVSPATQHLRRLDQNRSGDIEALVEAVEPAIVNAHNVIGRGVSNIYLVHRQSNIVFMNKKTADYVRKSITLEDIEKLSISVGSYNANTQYGRAYVNELGRTIPFKILRDSAPGTASTITWSLDRYENKQPSFITVRFKRVVSSDGRKKILIVAAQRH